MEKVIKEMPKIILHIHLDGSLRPKSVQTWLKKQGIERELKDITNNLMVDKNCRNLNEYLQKFDLPVQVLQNRENIKQATYELFEDLSKQNVIYAEIRFAPSKHLQNGLLYDDVVTAAIAGMEEAKKKFNIDGSLILCCMRGDTTKQNEAVVNVANKFLNTGVSAIDLAGAEAVFPTKDYAYIFKKAREQGVPFTIHAGEAAGSESIENALDFGAKRIGHGIRCIENKELMERLKLNNITLEICPTSNLQTQAITGKLPIEELYRKGLKVTINTDNNTVSNTDIFEEYEWILENTNLKIDDLIAMNINAANSVFAPIDIKQKLISKINDFKLSY